MSLPHRPTSHPLLRLALLLVGALVLLGGAAWTATAAGFGPAADDDDPAPVAAAAEPAPDVKLTADGLLAWLDVVGALEGLDKIAENAPFGAKKFFEQQTGTDFVPFLRDKIEAAVGSGISLTELDARLDDIDGDGDPASDVPGLDGVTVDLDVDLTARPSPGAYDVRIALKGQVAADSALAMNLDGLKVNGRDARDALKLDLATTLRLDPTAAEKVVIVADQAAVGTVRLGVDGAYDGADNPLAFQVGVLGVRATGTVKADAGVQVSLRDPNGDGVITLAELASPASLFRAGCVSDGAQLDLTVTADLAGITGKVGRLRLDDASLCNGLAAPDVELGDLAQFRSVTLGDVVNGLAQVTQALKSAQAAGDVPIPFVQEPLRDLVAVNEKLVAFFVDNGFTDPDNPMASISVDTADTAAVKTLQDLVPRLATALGMSSDALALQYDAGRVLLSVRTGADPAAQVGTVDFGELLTNVGITEVTGQASASIDPAYALDLGIGFDLAPGKALDQRFFLTNGSNGAVATLDAAVTADLDLTASASVLGVRLTDSDADGPVTLLQRKDAAKPMLSVALTDPDQDGRTTLAELAATGALPVKATVNAAVPSTTLRAEANAVGVPLGAGTVTLDWPDLADPTGLDVTADQTFLDTATPFTFDTEDPRALIGKILTVTRETITQMRSAVADGNATTTRPLPLVGKSVADLDPVLVKVQGVVDRMIQANDLLTLPALQAKLDEVLADALADREPGEDGEETEIPNIVDLDYEPRTATSPATILVTLGLGACTSDRADSRAGCTVTSEPVDVPFNLDLGTGSRVGGVAGIGTSGTVEVGYDARANLTFGVQLPEVVPGEKPTDLPKPRGDEVPKLFVQDDAAVDLGIGARVDGVLSAGLGPVQVSLGRAGAGEPKAQAAVAARFRVASPTASGKRLMVGSPAFTTWLGTLLPKPGQTTVHEEEDGLEATCAGVTSEVDACAALPVYAGSTPLGTVTFAAPDLLSPSGWSVDSSQVEANLKNEAIQFSLLVDGVRTLTRQVGEGLRSLPTGTKIPLVGADVTAGADVLDTFDTEVLGRVQTLSTTVASAATSGAVKTKAEEALANFPGLGGRTPTVTVTCRATDGTTVATCTGTEPIARLQSLEVRLPLSFTKSTGTGAFDLGFPGLRLATDDEVDGSAGLKVDLGFGVDRDLGFYVPTRATTDPEFAVTASAGLPNRMEGDLAFFPVEIVDQHAGHDVTVSAGLDLATSRADGRLPLADLGRARLTPKLKARADLDLGLRTLRPGNAPSALPTFRADLVLGAGIDWSGTPGVEPTTQASIRFEDVGVDAGALVSDFIKPVAKTLHTYTEPLEKPIEAIQQPIPGVAEAARLAGKKAPSWYEAFQAADTAANGGKPGTGLQMIDRVIRLVELVKSLNSATVPSGVIPLGSFTVLPEVAEQPVPLADADSLIGSRSVATPNVIDKLDLGDDVNLGDAKTKGGFSFPAFEKPSSLFGMLLGKDVALVYFDAGRLEAKRGFQFSYPIGPARLYIGGSAGVEGHLAAGFDTYGLRKAFEVVNDGDPTNDGAWSVAKGLLQGLYLDDFDQSGKDVPEIKFTASLSAGASVGIPGLEAGAEGGVEGVAEFNLRTDSAGKLRYTHIAEQLKVNKNPLCFFDASARVDAYIKAFVDTPLGKADYPIVSKRVYDQPDLFEFCRTPQPEEQQSLLAELLDDGTLAVKADGAPQSITLTQQTADRVEIAAQGIVEVYTGVSKVFADLQGSDDVIDVRYGVPDPTPTDHTDDVPALPVTLCGGAGNDRIMVQRGDATVYGDGAASCPGASPAGDDSLTTGSGTDRVEGGDGSDTIDTGAGPDTLIGGPKDDVLRGGLGSDEIDGGSGDDTTDYGDHTAPVTVNLPFPSGQAGEQDRAVDVENVYGGSAADTLNLPAGVAVRADGGSGDDTVVAGDGTALVMGGEGADHFVGGTGAAQFVGSGGDDTLVDGLGAQTFLGLDGRDTVDYSALDTPVRVVLDGEPGDGPLVPGIGLRVDNVVDADVVVGTAYADELTGGTAAEELRGGAGDDVLEGGPGADLLLGQGGDDDLAGNAGADRLEGGTGAEVLRGGADGDVLLGEAGDDDLDGEAGDDRLDGGADDDRVRGGEDADDLHGGAGFDWVDYSDRTDDLRVSMDGVAYDGAGFGSEKDNLHPDVEKYVGGSGQDEVRGTSGDQVFVTNDGDDVVSGDGGTDRFEGGEGDDRLYDLDFNSWQSTGGDGDLVDTFVGGEGNDQAYGNGGEDVFDLGDGDDQARAGEDDDTFVLGDGDDSVYAGAGDDEVHGEGGDDYLRGEDGDDLLVSGPSVKGGAVWGGLGSDTIHNGLGGGAVTTGSGGGSADDADATNTVYGYASPGTSHNSYTGSLGTDVYHLGVGYDIVSDPGGDDHIDVGDGGSTVNDYAGDDTIVGGDGEDQLHAGPGDDVVEAGGADDNLYGGAGADRLDGGDGRDGLLGGDGADVLDGGPGADDLYGEAGVDTVSYADRTTDVVVSHDGNQNDGGVEDASPGVTYRDFVRSDVERFVTGSGDDHVWLAFRQLTTVAVVDGGAGDDLLEVRSPVTADVTLVGGPGDDRMVGGVGDDTFDQGAAPDGADDITGGDGADVVDYGRRTAGSVRVTLDGVADDGASGEGDNIRPGVESAPGSDLGEQSPITLSLGAVSVPEGATGTTTPARFTVTLSRADAAPVTVPWSVAGGTATPGLDYGTAAGTVTVPAGATSATFDVPVLGDALDEPDETATVSVGDPTVTATLTIIDDDVPFVTPPAPVVPRLVVKPASVAEGRKGLRSMTFQVTLSTPTTVPVSVRLSTANGTAKATSDYLAASQVITFAPGRTTATFTVKVKGDKAKERNETLKVVASSSVGLTVGGPAVGTIRNDDKAKKRR